MRRLLANADEHAHGSRERLRLLASACGAAMSARGVGRSPPNDLPKLFDDYASELIGVGRLGDAVSVIAGARSQFPTSTLLRWRGANLDHRLGHLERADAGFVECLRPKLVGLQSERERAARSVEPAIGLAGLQLERGRLEPARRTIARALAIAPHDTRARCLEIKILLTIGDGATATERLGDVLSEHADHPDVRLMGGELAWLHGDPKAAADFWMAAVGPTDPGNQARAWLAVSELARGRRDHAARYSMSIVERDLTTAAARLLLLVLDARPWRAPDGIDARRLMMRTVRRSPSAWLRELQAAGACDTVQRFDELAPRYERLLPGIQRLATYSAAQNS